MQYWKMKGKRIVQKSCNTVNEILEKYLQAYKFFYTMRNQRLETTIKENNHHPSHFGSKMKNVCKKSINEDKQEGWNCFIISGLVGR